MFKPYYTRESGSAGYLFGFRGTRECAVVDPHPRDVDACAAFACSRGLRISHVFETHVRDDRPSGAERLAAKVGAARCAHESAPLPGASFAALKRPVVNLLLSAKLRLASRLLPGALHAHWI